MSLYNFSFLQMLFSRFWLKLISLALAALVWLFVQSKEMLEVGSTMEIKLVVGKNLAIGGAQFIQKDVTIRGPRGLVGKMGEQTLDATIYLPNSAGEKRLRVEKRFLDRSLDTRLSLTIHEPYFSVRIEEKISKTVPIKVALQGSPKEGFYVEKVYARPSNVTLSGPKSYIANLKQIATETWDVSDLSAYTTRELRLSIPTDVATMFSEDKTRVSLTIEREKVNQRFSGVKVDVLGSGLIARTIPDNVSITLQGHLPILRSIRKDGLRAFVQTQDLPAGVYELAIQVQIPQNTTLVETIPEFATVTLLPEK